MRTKLSPHFEYNKRWKDRGGLLTNYICQHCLTSVETPLPKKKDVGSKGYWDSCTTCPYCNKHNFVSIWPNNKIIAKKMPF